jgi:energy-converting hydrogenase Eha subunit A
MSSDKPVENFYPPSQLHNAQILQYYKDISCLIFGSASGILQLKAIAGSVFFIITSIISSIIYQITMTSFRKPIGKGYKITEFYANPIKDIYFGDIGRQIATFTMMWCLLGALVA